MTAYLRRTVMPEASAGSVDRAMRSLGLSGVRRDKGIRTTIPAKDGTRAGDLLDRDFSAAAPNRTWVTDFTYCRTWAGWVYVAFIVDVYAQRIVAWHAATTKQTDLVMIPLRMALWQRSREGHPTDPGELIHHSDAGSQYTSLRLTEHLALEEIRPSIGSVGDAYDNALMESINGLYKAECIRTTVFHDGPYKTIADVEYATAGWVDWYKQPAPALDPGKRPARRVRASPLRCPQPRAAPRIGTAENLGRFMVTVTGVRDPQREH
jgi:putative transposase